MNAITHTDLYEWCRIPAGELVGHRAAKIRLRVCADSREMGDLMARELVDEIRARNERGDVTRAILPSGPTAWFEPFAALVNRERVSLKNLIVFHMDECLDWEGRELPRNHPFCFRGEMEKRFYRPVDPELAVPEDQRKWPRLDNMDELRAEIWSAPIDITFGGWGQDGHVAYNQARRNPYSTITVEELRNASIRVQENNFDTIVAVAQRNFGSAYQFVPPMSITLGMKECLAAKKVRLFSDTGAWKQTALRVALFGPQTVEYPITLLQEHPDALLTATADTTRHPFSEHPEWDLGL